MEKFDKEIKAAQNILDKIKEGKAPFDDVNSDYTRTMTAYAYELLDFYRSEKNNIGAKQVLKTREEVLAFFHQSYDQMSEDRRNSPYLGDGDRALSYKDCMTAMDDPDDAFGQKLIQIYLAGEAVRGQSN